MFKSISDFQSLINRDMNVKASIRMVLTKALNKVLVSKELLAVIYDYTSERNTLDCALFGKLVSKIMTCP